MRSGGHERTTASRTAPTVAGSWASGRDTIPADQPGHGAPQVAPARVAPWFSRASSRPWADRADGQFHLGRITGPFVRGQRADRSAARRRSASLTALTLASLPRRRDDAQFDDVVAAAFRAFADRLAFRQAAGS